MQYDQLDPTKMSQNELRMHVARMQVELRNKEIQLLEQRQENTKLLAEQNLNMQEITDLKVKTERIRVELLHKDQKRPWVSKVVAFICSIIFLATTLLFNHAENLLNAKPPDPSGNTLFNIAFILYVGAALIMIFIAGENKI